MEKLNTEHIIVTSCPNLDYDSLLSSQGYVHFLKQKGFKVDHVQHSELSEIQKEIFELCMQEEPLIFDSDISFNFQNSKFMLINPNSIEKLHNSLNPTNIKGVMGKYSPEYVEELQAEHTHIEEVECFSTLITERFMNTNTPVDSYVASLLLFSILITLNGLEESITSNRDFVAVEFLQQHSHLTQEQITKVLDKIKY